MKTCTYSGEIHPQLSNNRHPVDGVLVGAGLVWPDHINLYVHLCWEGVSSQWFLE